MKKYRNYLLAGAGTATLCLLILLYFIFQAPFTAWNLVPNNAMLLLETTYLPRAYKDLQQKSVWKNLKDAPYINTLKNRLDYFLKSIDNASAKIDFWENKRVTLSLHWVGKEDFDALFIIPIQAKHDQAIYQQIIAQLQQNPNIELRQRNLSNFVINEIKNKDTEEHFAYFLHNGFWVGSFSSVLLEDVVRKIDTNEPAYSFAQANELKRTLKQNKNISNNFELYLNLPRLAEGLTQTLPEHLQKELSHIANLGTQTYLQLEPKTSNIAWNGYTFAHKPDKNNHKGLASLQQQQASPFTMAHLIPQNAYLVYTLQINKPQAFAESNTALQDFAPYINGSISLAHLTTEGKDEGSLLFIKIQNPTQFLAYLTKQNLIANEREQVGAYSFQPINNWSEWQKKLGINALNNFKKAYSTLMGQYIVIANDQYALRQYLQDYQNKKTWQHLPAYQSIAHTLKTPSNFTLITYAPLLWGRAYEWLTPKFQMLLSIYEGQLKAMNWIVWQNSANGNAFNTYLKAFPLAYSPESTTEDTTKTEYTTKAQINFGELLYTQPYLVKNFETQETEILIQDFRNTLFLLNEKGTVLWKRPMYARIINSPAQIDIYNNNRWQYAVGAGSRFHLIDKLGRNVSGFPVNMTDSTSHLLNASILDASNNKDYWFTGSDERGRVFVLGKRVQWIAGWNPKRLAYKLGTPLQAVKVKENTYLIAIQENGQIHAFKQTGEELAGFPIHTKQRFNTQMHIETSATLASTYITTISEEGKLIRFNLAGKLLKEEQLYRPSGKTRFELVQNDKKDNCFITITSETYWQVANRNGEKILEEDISNHAGKCDIQLFEITAGKHIIAVTNKSAGKTSLYDMRGTFIGEPFQSNTPIALRYDTKQKQLVIYRVMGNKLSILTKSY